jgi:hypothetical protein
VSGELSRSSREQKVQELGFGRLPEICIFQDGIKGFEGLDAVLFVFGAVSPQSSSGSEEVAHI